MLSKNLQTLVNRRGQQATLRKMSSGTYSPSTGQLVSVTDTDYTVKAYFSSYTLEETTGSNITVGDRMVTLPALDTSGVAIPEPDNEDQILSVGDTVVIKSVQKIYNSGTLVCYLCHVRE